jgi:hypothetical protein
MTAIGRKRPDNLTIFLRAERPLSRKADIQPGVPEIGLPNGRFPPESRRWAVRLVTGR